MSKMRVAVIGAGISGLVSAYVLAKAGVDVVLYEKEEYLGGHAKTVNFDGVDLDLGFMVFNRVTYPNMMEFFESLGVDMEASDMSFSVSLDKGQGCEWGSLNGLSSLFAQKKNAINPYFWQMLREIVKFKHDVLSYLELLENNPDIDRNETLGQFIYSRGYSKLFREAYLIPICGSIWSCPSEGVMSFSAFSILSFCRNHHLLQIFGRPQWLTVRWRSHCYVKKVREVLENKCCQIRTSSEVQSVVSNDEGCTIICGDGSEETYNGCILAVHAPDALKILGRQTTFDEMRILGAFQYVYSDIFLHRDKSLMPTNQAAWSAWNFLGSRDNKVCLTYWLNVLQNLGETDLPFLVTLNPDHTPKSTMLKWSTAHPVPSVAASKASLELDHIQGKRGIWFCGAYQGYGFHEDGLKAGMAAAHGMLGKSCALLSNAKHMVPSLIEMGARLSVTRFLGHYISAGCVILLEEGGTVFNFEGTMKKCSLRTVLRVHSPQFYWKVMTRADLGLADAYINGDFSFVDKREGLLNLFMILIASRDANSSISKLNKKRGWWTPLLFTASIASAKYFFWHVSRQNTLTQARRNISRHYDLSNDLFALFLDETMTYSSAVFKKEDEDLKVAQLRKISLLIEKARIDQNHEVLEIGCGWGSLAIEVVKRTGCKYTGITLSKEQLKFAEKKVREVGLQDHIKFILCDYRQLPDTNKYDRIISCEMLEAVGHEFMEEFFRCCESVLREDGLLVLQFISIPDERYEEYRQSSDFIKEYIFPGGCVPSLSRVTSAMAAASRFCVEDVENIGIHYYQTLRYWRKNFLEKQSKILTLGFNEKFIRTWEYYFDYCAAGFKTHTLGNYQIVFSRPGNAAAFSNPYQTLPSES
ncbi:uncharacterized protein LOC122276579 isoform X1 [Carya illinoinensis]|uniref:Amine oxidase domain-containing protein n=2 Tax=Carya illinoinensis TaxID=32201 RepID=A0A8T1RRN4_CARIL|nr:uncharacterized protein LOC122276579 isoform X1 [Carya illinoinensis]XP_042942353.1 uncharacterized protein LOC122276579 isoform X1 [Carya illinoinensis]KAG6668571.1 hypothetical protein CIPAW_01G180200 [Carya illinoinensis]KAG6668572.1 hypothetical protein CIPAW_01G180200 [Carya illinoinensis]KAG6732466.1 hypothetical protein I3842_01G179800 [Carya illinoinensis]KAG6732467.1 hypothetical protein I3842_01G179800 [Carya illinoinensis]KAG6732468.1 hypothetical protein I3842_01G179800 [Carya 